MKKMNITSKAIQNKIDKMDSDLQEAFYHEYNKRAKSYSTALFLAITGIHYLYFGKWFLLILFFCSSALQITIFCIHEISQLC